MKPPFETPVSAPAPVSSRPTLADLLRPEANNLDLIRLICASLVIYGHAFTLSPDPAWPALTGDPTLHLGYPGVYCGSIAVKVFFFISGLLVTNSLLTRRSVSHYLCGRFFRIWPALIVVVLVTALGLGPWLSSLSAKEYFSRFAVPRYIAGNLLMSVQGGLPGVFAGNPLPSLVNGVLWTLPFEVGAYLALLFFAAVGLLREEDGLSHGGRLIRDALEPRLRETAFTLACEVVAAEAEQGQAILQMLDFIGTELRLDKLTTAAIERGTRARYQRIEG